MSPLDPPPKLDDRNQSNLELLREISARLLDPEIATAAFEDAPDPYLLIKDGKVQLVNKQAEAFFGYPRREMYDKPWTDFLPDIEHVSSLLTNFLNSQKQSATAVNTVALSRNKLETQVVLNISFIVTFQGVFMGATLRPLESTAQIVKGPINGA